MSTAVTPAAAMQGCCPEGRVGPAWLRATAAATHTGAVYACSKPGRPGVATGCSAYLLIEGERVVQRHSGVTEQHKPAKGVGGEMEER